MSRVKQFDETEVLDQALELFRARGFKHTSFSDLTRELGISRQSLYDTYGDKQSLYQTALRRHFQGGLESLRRRFAAPSPVREHFAQLFEFLITGVCSGGSHGCPLVNAMVELSPHDADTRALAQTHAREFEALFVSRLSAAQRQGELSRDKDPAALARFLYHTILGLAVASRTLGDKESLRQSARVALQLLD